MTTPEAKFAIHPIFAAMLACSSPAMANDSDRTPVPDALKRATEPRQDAVNEALQK